MENVESYEFRVEMNEKNLWRFSLYHTNRGFLGIFNVLFSLASLFLLVTTWSDIGVANRLLLMVCMMLFPVFQPFQLWLKAKRQASLAVMKETITMTFTRDGFTVRQAQQEQELTWESVVRVEGTKRMLMFYMDRVRAFLLPEECMGGEREAFCRMLKEVLPKERHKRI